ncbi:MAG: 5'-nucleotidase C-terminal domain-containing protein [Gemmatimonadetes bacterium]|nr:5'-nucleotidase C-terminal domain-containing protein [Gemmatimonadota bacterium]
MERTRAALGALFLALAVQLPAQGLPVDIIVASTTDVHGRLRGWDYYADTAEAARGLTRAATIVDSVRAANPGRVILVDAGDLLQGNPLTYAAARIDTTGVHPVIAAMNAMRYDAAAVGNHEFNYGLPTLRRAMAGATFPFLAANVRTPDGKRAWSAFTVVERSGLKIAIVGATTPGSMVWDREQLVGRLTIGDIIAEVRQAVDEARNGGADVVVVVVHAGLSGDTGDDTVSTGLTAENPVARLAQDVPGIDAIVYGHSHREVADTSINGVLLTQPRNWATSVSVAHLQFEIRGATWRPIGKHASIVQAAGHAEQPALIAVVAKAHDAARRYAGTVAGRTEITWRADSARVADTPIMDFVLETMRKAAGADLASAAAFSLDVKIAAGPITVAQLAQLYPYDNTLKSLRISGAQLRAYLEQSASYFDVTGSGDALQVRPNPKIPGYNFEMVAGADYQIDLTKPAGARVAGLSVRGKPVRDGDSFTIALSNYRAGGAGGYAMLNGAPVVHDKQLEIRQLLIDEVTRRGTLRPSDYFVRNWSVTPAALAAQALRAITGAGDFEAVRPAKPAAPATASSPAASPAAPSRAGRPAILRIISTNDFHGALEPRPDGNNGLRGGAAQVAALIHKAEVDCAANCVSILVDGGDLFQGTPASNLAFGRPIVTLYNALGYAATALGNHEFDWGQDSLRARIKGARFAILAANVRNTDGSAVSWIRADTIVERGGLKIGIIGVATPATPSMSKKSNVAGLRFDPPAASVNASARSLRARGADVVVVVAHAGAFCSRDTGCAGEILDLAREITEPVDAIVSGHTHSLVNTEVNGVPIVQARSSGRSLAVIDLPVDRAARATQMKHDVWTVTSDSITPDPAVAALLKSALAAVAPLVSRPIVTVATAMERTGAQYALGNLIADAERAATNADIGLMNNGGIRANLAAGPATYGALFEIQPFANQLVKLRVPGRALRVYLESLVRGDAPRNHVSGVTVRYDKSKPAGARIVEARVAAELLDDDRSYTLVFPDIFVSDNADYVALAKAATATETPGVIDLDALIAYLSSRPGGTVTADAAPRLISVAP